jgi:hypothetical protein
MIDNENHGPTNDWYFPFPVAEISSATEASIPEQTPYLFSRTQRSFVLGRRVGGRANIIALGDRSSGISVGTLHLHFEEQLERFPFAENAPTSGREHLRNYLGHILISKEDMNMATAAHPPDEDLSKIEIVAVSMTRYDAKTWNEEAQRCEKPFVTTEEVNVLWIEWEDGIAYRSAAGHIRKEYWEQLEREDIDLVIG